MAIVADRLHWIAGRLFRRGYSFSPLSARKEARSPYRLSRLRLALHRFVSLAPYALRERLAEAFLRRAEAPGPAAEHVFQYLLSAEQGAGDARDATVAKGADNFYLRQYRQYLNQTMGVFAMTATQAVLGAGAPRRAGNGRDARLAMSRMIAGARPILVLDHQSIATPLYLPPLRGEADKRALSRWLATRGPAPYRSLILGDEMRCAEKGVRARRRSATAAMIETADAALRSRKLALLALHPYDPDAMGLHITLFGVEALTADTLERDYALGADVLDPWKRAALEQGALLYFLVGGIEESFTQCSQNLFVKRPRQSGGARRASWDCAWSPCLSLNKLLEKQFEIFQGSVSSWGLPGVSPRNGEIGMSGFVARREARVSVLIPYFVGNAVHGHAAKLWSNPNGALLIWDDHCALCAVTINGPARVVTHRVIAACHPDIIAKLATRRRRNGESADDPEYWFEQEVVEIVMQDEPVDANVLDPARASCSIHAAGLAMHGKKPAYFAAESLPPYDMAWQHEREREGRPCDPSGAARRYWEWECAPTLEARRAHLEEVEAAPG